MRSTIWWTLSDDTIPKIPTPNYCAVNAGQLKNVASLFFERLHGVGLSNPERLNFNGIDLKAGRAKASIRGRAAKAKITAS